MKLFKCRLLLPLLAALLACGCGAQETAEPVKETPTEEVSLQSPLAGFVQEDGGWFYYEDGVRKTFAPGVQMIEEKAYFVEQDGETLCAGQGVLQASDGCRYYFESDSSLRRFEAGFAELPDGVYYVPADGYALASFSGEVRMLEDTLYAFDGEGRVMTLEAGVQELFGKLYLVQEAGRAVGPAAPGLLLWDGALYDVQEDGSLLTDSAEGYLYFGADGRYTSGSTELDEAVAAVFDACLTEEDTEPEQMLRAAYTYLRDNYTYLSMDHYEAGTTDWMEDSALRFFQLGKGNCYCWAAAVACCARQLGYQAYVVAGWESNASNDHAWTMIDWPDGETYLFDAELEYAYWYMFSGAPKVDMFKASGDGFLYNGFAYYFP